MPPSAGIYNPTVNVGKMVNKGFELELNYGDNINGFDYNIGFNLSTIHNEMLKADPNQVLYGSAWKVTVLRNPNTERLSGSQLLAVSD